MNLRDVQRRLAGMNLYGGAIDGVFGPRTAQAIEALFLARPVLSGSWNKWSAARRAAAAAQIFCMLDGIDVGPIDGLPGPQTRYAFEIAAARERGIEGVDTWRDQEPAPPRAASRPAPWPGQRQAEMERCFGPVGANQTTLTMPADYPLHLAWDKTKKIVRFSCHEKIHDAARRVFARVLDDYGPSRIRALGLDRFGGCLNVRRMRGGSAWSTHAWGAAFDFDPENNQLQWTKSRARFARPDYERWWSLWEEEGLVSLGRACDFDWMHVQAARL